MIEAFRNRLTIKKFIMEKSNGAWWKGSFPSWIVAILIAIIAFFLQRELQISFEYRERAVTNISDLRVKVEGLQSRIAVLEQATRENHTLLTEIVKHVNLKNP